MIREERKAAVRSILTASEQSIVGLDAIIVRIVDVWEHDVADERFATTTRLVLEQQARAAAAVEAPQRLPHITTTNEYYVADNGDHITVRRFTRDGEFAGVRVFIDGHLSRSYETEVGLGRLKRFLERVGATPAPLTPKEA